MERRKRKRKERKERKRSKKLYFNKKTNGKKRQVTGEVIFTDKIRGIGKKKGHREK